MPQETPLGPSGPAKYCIFGCGTIGYNIILELAKENEGVVVVDRDESRVRHLRDQKYDAYQRELTSPDLLAGLPVFEIAFVMTGDADANLAAVFTIKKRYPSVQIVARTIDPVNGQKLTAAGAEFVLYPQEVVARSAVLQIKKQHSSRISQRLFTLLAGWEGTLRHHHPQEPGSRCDLLCHGPCGDRKARKPENPHHPDLLRGQHRPPGEPDLRQPARHQDGAPDTRGALERAPSSPSSTVPGLVQTTTSLPRRRSISSSTTTRRAGTWHRRVCSSISVPGSGRRRAS